jgi:hypothetical protein
MTPDLDWGRLLVAQLEFYWDDGPQDPPRPAPLTTIAWRMMHIAVGCFTIRTSTFFGDGSVPDDADMFDPRHIPADLPHTATDGLAFLHDSYRQWHDHIAALDDAGMRTPLGPKGAYFSADPMAALIVHVNRETMHHGGEIGMLRGPLPGDRSRESAQPLLGHAALTALCGMPVTAAGRRPAPPR